MTVNTVFARKEIHKGTCTSPDGNTINQIDHVLIDKRNAQLLVATNIRSYRGAESSTDHILVVAPFYLDYSRKEVNL